MADFAQLANIGAIGIVLGYVLTQIVPRLDRIDRSLNLLARSQMLTLLKLSEDAALREQAVTLLRELDPNGHYDHIGKPSRDTPAFP